jgi:hypothetical protein
MKEILTILEAAETVAEADVPGYRQANAANIL